MNKNMPADTLEASAAEDRVTALEEENRKLRKLAHEAERLRRENETMRSKKRLGLVWEQEAIEAEVTAPNMAILPQLIVEENARDVSRPEGDSGNLVIEGDNLDALRLLSKTHKGKVDCIYIDPPYNTGNTTFVYNDRFVDPEHRWRKSMWLDFLHKRLLIARELLSERGVILVSINDHHRALMELLMDEVMPGRRVGSIVWRSRQGTSLDGNGNLSTDHEHILIYANTDFSFHGKEKTYAGYKFDDGDGKGPYERDNLTLGFSHTERPNLYYPIQDPATGRWFPANPDRVWAYASANRIEAGKKLQTRPMEEWISENKIYFPPNERVATWNSIEEIHDAIESGEIPANGNGVPLLRHDLPNLEFFVGKPVSWGVPRFKRHKKDLKSEVQPLSSWVYSTVDKVSTESDCSQTMKSALTRESDSHLKSIFGKKVFNYAKPPSLMRELLRQATPTDGLVMDFFAGSGTTAEAVLRLNQEDGGSRRFISVSSTEATDKEPKKNVCRDVCAPRINAACEGYGSGKKRVEGTGEGFAYLRLDRVNHFDLEDEMNDDLAWTLIQIQHDRPVTAFAPTNGVMIDGGGETAIALCSDLTEEAIEILRNATTKSMILYTEYPGYAAEKLCGCAIEARPAYDTAIRIAK